MSETDEDRPRAEPGHNALAERGLAERGLAERDWPKEDGRKGLAGLVGQDVAVRAPSGPRRPSPSMPTCLSALQGREN